MFKLATLSDATETTHKLFEMDIRGFLDKLPAEFNKYKADLTHLTSVLKHAFSSFQNDIITFKMKSKKL